MEKKLAFDTLEYAKLLQAGGVSAAEVHASSLAVCITHNIYTKPESEKMIEAALKQFEERTYQIREEMRIEAQVMRNELRAEIQEVRNELRSEIQEVRNELRFDIQQVANSVHKLEQQMSRTMTRTISILGSMIVALDTVPNLLIHMNWH